MIRCWPGSRLLEMAVLGRTSAGVAEGVLVVQTFLLANADTRSRIPHLGSRMFSLGTTGLPNLSSIKVDPEMIDMTMESRLCEGEDTLAVKLC